MSDISIIRLRSSRFITLLSLVLVTKYSFAQGVFDSLTYDSQRVPFRLKNNNYIYVDSASMKPISGKQWDNIFWYDKKSGFAKAEKSGQWGIINQKEDFVVEPEWDWAEVYDGFIYLVGKNKHSFKNSNLEELSPPDIEINEFKNYFFNAIQIEKKATRSAALINKQGQILIPYGHYEDFKLLSFNKGFIGAKNHGKWGVIDTAGNMLTPFLYDALHVFETDNLIAVNKSGKWGYIDSSNTIKIPIEYESCGLFSDGLLNVKKGYRKWGYINRNNETIIPFSYADAYSFENGLALAQNMDGRFGIIDYRGNWVIPPDYQSLSEINNNRIVYQERDLFGILNTSGTKVTKAIYSDIYFSEGLWLVFSSNKKKFEAGFIDSNGSMIIPFYDYRKVKYHSLQPMTVSNTISVRGFKHGYGSVWKVYSYNSLPEEWRLVAYFDRAGRLYCDH